TIQVVEQRRGLGGVALTVREQMVEPLAMRVVPGFTVAHGQRDHEALSQPTIEIDQVRVHVVQERAFRHQPERDREPATERLDQPALLLARPMLDQVGKLPPLAAGPLQRRARRVYTFLWGS